MVPFFAFGFGAFAVYNAYRYFANEWVRVNDALDETLHQATHGKRSQMNADPVTLVKDPVTGEYRPSK